MNNQQEQQRISLTYNTEKVIKGFCVVGLNEDNIKIINNSNSNINSNNSSKIKRRFISQIDIIQHDINNTNTNTNTKKLIKSNNEIWYRINKLDSWMRVFFTEEYDYENHPPITGIKLIECDKLIPTNTTTINNNNNNTNKETNEYLLMKQKEITNGYIPVKVHYNTNTNNINQLDPSNILDYEKHNESFIKISNSYNLKNKILLKSNNSNNPNNHGVILAIKPL